MPDVRRACAAPVPGTGRLWFSSHIRATGPSCPGALRPTQGSPPRWPLTTSTQSTVALRSLHLAAQQMRRPTTGTAANTSFTAHMPSRGFALRALRSRGCHQSAGYTLSIGVRHSIERRRRTAKLHSISGLRFRPGSSAQLRSRPGPVPRASAVTVLLHPPRIHSVAPNPGMQRTRYARR
jgi:hypothetical protein